jgi:hypothetical protein
MSKEMTRKLTGRIKGAGLSPEETEAALKEIAESEEARKKQNPELAVAEARLNPSVLMEFLYHGA